MGPFHIPQQSRRHKLRFTPQDDAFEFSLLSSQQAMTGGSGGLNLSLSTQTRSASAYNPSPVGPFTGYALILGRSKFLRPAQELLEDFCRGSGVSSEEAASKLLEESGSWFGSEEDDISRRCSNPSLVSLLHEVYKRYRLYCQQMHSAVTSFESVAGLANAAPFVCFAIKSVFRHFQCLKNAILDHIRITSKSFGSANPGKGGSSGSCSNDKARFEQNQVPDTNFLQHPVWRSQRGFPDKAVSVLRTWLFEHFLHPYPSDSDKQMLAQKTGLSRSQVSNWFTNARVRLWKPMVEEMHALERKAQCSKAPDTPQFTNSLADQPISVHSQPSQREFQIHSAAGQDSQCKRSRIELLPRVEQSKEQFGMNPCYHLPNNQVPDVGGSQTGELVSHSSALRGNQETATGMSWSASGQIVPFWLAKQ